MQNINWDNITYKNTADYTELNGFIAIGKVVKVYDGDTFWIAINFGPSIKRIKIRIARIDCPEIRPKKDCKDAECEKQNAILAKMYVENLIADKMVRIEIIRKDLYGRYLAEVFVNEENLGDKILGAGHAKIYA
jgi:endonuclease YncB( thermonuclease family)